MFLPHYNTFCLTLSRHGYEALLFRTQTKRTNRKESSGREAPDDLVSLANARRSHFVRTDLGDAELDAGDVSNRRMQLQAITDRNEGSFEQICKLLQKLFGSHDVKQITAASSQDRHHAEALKFFKAFAKMKDEFVSMLQFVSKHRDYVSALDELSMSFSRMIAASPGERIDPSEEHFKMHLMEAPQRLLMLATTHSEGCAMQYIIIDVYFLTCLQRAGIQSLKSSAAVSANSSSWF